MAAKSPRSSCTSARVCQTVLGTHIHTKRACQGEAAERWSESGASYCAPARLVHRSPPPPTPRLRSLSLLCTFEAMARPSLGTDRVPAWLVSSRSAHCSVASSALAALSRKRLHPPSPEREERS